MERCVSKLKSFKLSKKEKPRYDIHQMDLDSDKTDIEERMTQALKKKK